MMDNRAKIVALWVIFLLGMTVHALLAVIPIFFGADVAMPDATGEVPASQMWMILFFFLIPIIFVVATLFTEAMWYRIANFALSIVLTIMNIFHLAEHAGEGPVDPRQIVLLTFVLTSGIFLNIVALKWIREPNMQSTGG